MTYYLLPKSSTMIYKYIDCIEKETLPTPAISNSLSEYLYDIKKKLEEREKDWDIFKKYTNPYEYIHTSVPFKKKCISKYKPLSRSYFKMIEIINTFNLFFDSKQIRTFHLAEGPGGFIEAIAGLRKCSNDIYIGMTIIDENQDPNIPGWKKSDTFLRQNNNVYIETGIDNTGDILSLENFVYVKDTYASSMDLITADGGFDFSIDFNNQEINIAKLLFGQIAYAIIMQKKCGTFILKVFDCFMNHTIDLLYILSSFYDKVYIMKPNTSRYANSEKYIICKGFLFTSCEQFYPFFYRAFEKMTLSTFQNNIFHINRFISIPIPYSFIIKLEEYNAIIGQQQIENIHYTISLIENKHKQDKIDNLIKTNIQKCIQWCTKYNIPYNPILTNNNIFINQSFLDKNDSLVINDE
jgi:23S rRNA U2552 (ribose-2'-O)-methylase RlmE/FtsJ